MKILLVEDDLSTGIALQETLTRHHYSVDLATDGQAGLEMANAFEYDLILLDVIIPKLDGISVCQQLRSQGYHNPILLLTGQDSSNDRILGLDSGADDYVVKPFDMGELLARIRALLRRGKPLASAITWEQLKVDPSINQVTCNDQPIHLTPKEYCLLELFLLNPKRIFSRSAILDRLWDFADSPGEETVSTHIKCLRQKLKAAGSTDPIETVHGLGYRLRLAQHKPEAVSKVTTSIAQIWDRTQPNCMTQLGTLEAFADALSTAPNSPLQQQAQQDAHKLAGSLGIFGRKDGSQLARQLEHLLQQPLDRSHATQVTSLVAQLRQAIAQSPDIESQPAKQAAPLILIVDDDLPLADRIRVEAIAWGLRVEVATDVAIARKAIAQSPPNVILLDLNFPGSDNGFALLQNLAIPVVVFTGSDRWRDRLAVAQLGGVMFLQKPLPSYAILKAVTDVLQRPTHQNRVMVVDGDRAIAADLAAQLQELEIISVQHPQEFWQRLTDVQPNLLVLESDLPDVGGAELCRIVRADPQWHCLPTVIFSDQPLDVDRAFAAGADECISKTAGIEALATWIRQRLQRVRRTV
jgi:DNA-binding response OmpR family regulator